MNANSLPSTPREVARLLRAAYSGLRGPSGLLVKYRPFICPFEEVLRRIPENSTLLDVGCGVGICSVLAASCNLSRRVVGFDTSATAIEAAKRAVVPASAQVEFKVVSQFEWPAGQFDVVICIDVLHHVPPAHQADFVARACASVRAGGRLVFKDLASAPWWRAWANRLHDLAFARQWVHYRSAETAATWIERAGFEVSEAQSLPRLWYAHYLATAEKTGGKAGVSTAEAHGEEPVSHAIGA